MNDTLLVAVLPKPRKSRHPYQWCVCAGLLFLSASQLVMGSNPASSTAGVASAVMVWLSLQTILACALILLAAVIRDGWWRLCVELMGQVFAASVFGFFTFAIWQKAGLAQGLSIGIALTGPLTLAASLRAAQIVATIRAYHHAIILSAEQAGQ